MDSVDVPDNCFEEKHRNESRKWIFKYGYGWIYKSTFKDDFTVPTNRNSEMEGVRRKAFKDKMWQESAEEVLNERQYKATDVEYCSTYDSDFQKNGFVPQGVTEEVTELHKKYPLYSSPPLTCYMGVVNKCLKHPAPLSNMSKIIDPASPFKRSYAFSKPMGERFDEPM